MVPVVGIDLGTSTTCVAVVQDGEVKVIPDERGRTVTPSVVALNKFGKYVIGHFAKAQQITNPYETIYSIKRLMGQRFHSPEVKTASGYLTYPIEEGPDGRVRVRMRDRTLSPEEVSAEILKKMKEICRNYLGTDVQQAVITVPAHFNDGQRRATMEAGRLAGLEVIRLLNEPTAAALAFGYRRRLRERIVVYDFGGGTFDVSLLRVDGDTFEVVSTGGDTYLGGDDITWRIVEHLIGQFLASDNIDLRLDKMAMQRVVDAAEAAKMDLSFREETVVDLPRVAPNVDPDAHLHIPLTRRQVEAMADDLIERSLRICDATLAAAACRPADMDEVLLVGGQTRMPLIRQRVAEYFGKAPAVGPNPDEVVAMGAAIQAHTLTAPSEDVLLLDVTPLTLGIASLGDLMTPIIAKNTKIPYRTSKVFTTSRDFQDKVRITVYQGEARKASENSLLGEFVLQGIRSAPRMEPRIDVTFRVDANGILQVGARDKDTGQAQSIVIRDFAQRAKQAAAGEGPGGEETGEGTPAGDARPKG